MVVAKTSGSSNKSFANACSGLGTLSFRARYVAKRVAKRTVSPPKNSQKPRNLFFPSRVCLSGEAGHVSAVQFSSALIMPYPPYPFHQVNLLYEYESHDHLL